jgi:hypothetical protein
MDEKKDARRSGLSRKKHHSDVTTKTVEVNTFETVDLVKRLYRFDKIMKKARKGAGYLISDVDFSRLQSLYKEIDGKFEEFEKLGRELKLDKGA